MNRLSLTAMSTDFMLNTGHSFAGKQALCFRSKFTFLTSAGNAYRYDAKMSLQPNYR
jgi:hypothetical protein